MSLPTHSIWVGQVELSQGLKISPVLRSADISDQGARIWIRRDGVPLGHCEITMVDGLPDMESLRNQVDERFDGESGLDDGHPAASASAQRDQLQPFTVIVATKGRPELAGHSLSSLRELDFPTFDVLLIDGSLDNRTSEVFQRIVGDDARFRYISELRPGLSLARKIGMSQARNDLVAFTDDDCRVDPLWLRSLSKGFARDANVACVTGMVPSSDLRTNAQRYFDNRVAWSTHLTPRTYTSKPIDGDPPLYPFQIGMYGTGANFAMRRHVAIELGWFSELMGAGGPCRGGGEDQDMFVRVVRSGWHLAYEPSAMVWHEGRVSDTDLRAQLEEWSRGIPISGLKWLVDPTMRGPVLRRIPRAAIYYLTLLREKGQGIEDGPTDDVKGWARGSMAWAEARAIPKGVAAFVSGYRIWRRQESGYDSRRRRSAV